MARKTGETVGNTPRDLLDSFVGMPAEPATGGTPPKKTRGPKKVTGNTFHSSVSGGTALHRADRAGGYFRSGGFVKRAGGGGTATRFPTKPVPIKEPYYPGVLLDRGFDAGTAKENVPRSSRTIPTFEEKRGGVVKKKKK